MAGERGRGLPGPRPLPKKRERAVRAVVEVVETDFPELFGETSRTNVFDKCGGVGEHVIRGELRTLAHIPAETQAARLDPVVRDSLEGASVLGKGLFDGAGIWKGELAGLVFDGGS